MVESLPDGPDEQCGSGQGMTGGVLYRVTDASACGAGCWRAAQTRIAGSGRDFFASGTGENAGACANVREILQDWWRTVWPVTGLTVRRARRWPMRLNRRRSSRDLCFGLEHQAESGDAGGAGECSACSSVTAANTGAEPEMLCARAIAC